jgi:hypothetical protein
MRVGGADRHHRPTLLLFEHSPTMCGYPLPERHDLQEVHCLLQRHVVDAVVVHAQPIRRHDNPTKIDQTIV